MKREASYDTDTNKSERIWKKVQVNDGFYTNHNERTPPEKLVKWTEDTLKKGKKEGLLDLHLTISYRDDEFGSIESQYLICYGYRMETTEEYKARLKTLITRAENDKFMFEQKMWYYTEVRPGESMTAIDKKIFELETNIKQAK
jgi:hypothetical protein